MSDESTTNAQSGSPVPDGTSPVPDAEPTGEQAGAADAAEEAHLHDAATAPDAAARPSEDKPHRPRPPRRRPRDPGVARAFRAGLPVEGTVEKVIKGGYEVRVGKCRGFCPHSQIDLHHVDQPEENVGKTYRFKITQMRRGGEDVVVSRRAVLEEERGEEAKAVRATLIEGAVMQGRVARLADFGAFVDLGAGVTGLVHVSEISHARVTSASEFVNIGERVAVRILKLDDATGRISLSMRQASEDPWRGADLRFPAGSVHAGSVTRLADFGAFVEFAPGVEALASSREFPPSPGGWSESVTPGTSRPWLVLSVDPSRRRMAIAPASDPAGEHPQAAVEAGAKVRGKVQKVERFGVFVWLGPGQVGLIPNAWTGTPRGTDLVKHFPVGHDLEVMVVEVTEGGRRIRLTLDEAATAVSPGDAPRRSAGGDREGRSPFRSERERRPDPSLEPAPPQPAPSFGTNLGDALKSALERNRKRRA